MQVREIIQHLESLPQDLEVYVSADAEGNSFLPAEDFGVYYARTEELDRPEGIMDEDELIDDEWELDEIQDYLTKIVVIWPA